MLGDADFVCRSRGDTRRLVLRVGAFDLVGLVGRDGTEWADNDEELDDMHDSGGRAVDFAVVRRVSGTAGHGFDRTGRAGDDSVRSSSSTSL
jgi:hypothetical protein